SPSCPTSSAPGQEEWPQSPTPCAGGRAFWLLTPGWGKASSACLWVAAVGAFAPDVCFSSAPDAGGPARGGLGGGVHGSSIPWYPGNLRVCNVYQIGHSAQPHAPRTVLVSTTTPSTGNCRAQGDRSLPNPHTPTTRLCHRNGSGVG